MLSVATLKHSSQPISFRFAPGQRQIDVGLLGRRVLAKQGAQTAARKPERVCNVSRDEIRLYGSVS